MAVTVAEAKVVIADEILKLTSSIEKEVNYLKELTDDTTLLAAIQQMQANGDSMPVGSAYSSYEEWIEQINKEIKTTDTSLARIDKEKSELLAFEYFVANAS